jgi:hypothetical protein
LALCSVEFVFQPFNARSALQRFRRHQFNGLLPY